ncbi:MAG: hypothetical protein N2971_03275, partial [Chlorobi bacterium]|nr:hypothetical protein [Chlorobiota bacterium]
GQEGATKGQGLSEDFGSAWLSELRELRGEIERIPQRLDTMRQEILQRLEKADNLLGEFGKIEGMRYDDIRRQLNAIENQLSTHHTNIVNIVNVANNTAEQVNNTAMRVNETHQLLTRYHNAVGTLLHETAEHIAGLENQLETYTKKVGELESTLHMLLEKNYASTRWSIALAAIAVGLLVYALIG